MSHYLTTALILLVAVALCLAGASAGAPVVIGVAALFEVWFWVRVFTASTEKAPAKAP